jgi:O-antigen/teichoic acid export membrane protein
VFGRRVLVLAGGTALGQAIVMAASPILTRLYTAEHFGYLALYTSIVSLVSVVGALRYQLAIPLPEDDRDGLALVVLSTLAVAATTAVATAVLLLAGPAFLDALGAAQMAPYVWLVPIGLLGAGAHQILSYWAIRLGAIRQLAATKVAQGVALAATQIGLGAWGLGAWGLLVGDAVGRAAGSVTLARSTLPGHGFGLRTLIGRLPAVAARYRRFPLLSAGSALLNTAGLQLPPVLLLATYGPEVAGFYAFAVRIVSVPLQLVGTSVSQVFTGQAASVARENVDAVMDLYRTTAWRLALVALPIAAVLLLFGPGLFAFVFSEAWRTAGVFGRALAPMLLLQMVASPLSQTLNVLERQDLQLIWDAARLLVVVGVLVAAGAMAWPATLTVTVLGAGMAAMYALLLLLTWGAIRAARRAVP